MQTPTSTPASTPASTATEISIPDAIRQLRALDAAFAETTKNSASASQSKLNLNTADLHRAFSSAQTENDAEKQDADAAPENDAGSKMAQRLRLAAALAALLPLCAGWTVFCFFYVQSTFTRPWPAPAFAACIALAAALPLLSTLAVCGALRVRVIPRDASQRTRKASNADAAQQTRKAADAVAAQRKASNANAASNSDADASQRTASDADADASQRSPTGSTDAAQRATTGSNLKDSEPVTEYSFRKPALVFLLAAALALVPPLAVYGAFLAHTHSRA